MAVITGLGLIATLLSAVLSKLAADELKAWSPRITRSLIRRAVAALPAEQRSRYEEEWNSHVGDVPGELGKLFASFSLLWAARDMSAMVAGKKELGIAEASPEVFRDPDGVHVVKEYIGSIIFRDESVIIESGVLVCGDVHARSVEIRPRGAVKGNVFAKETLSLRHGCRMEGDATTPHISIEEGSYLRGKVDITSRLKTRCTDVPLPYDKGFD